MVLLLSLSSCTKVSAGTQTTVTSGQTAVITEVTTVQTTTAETTAASDSEPEETFIKVEIKPFTFAVSGDSNPAGKTEPQTEDFKTILSEINNYNPAFYISTGDIIHGGTGDKSVMKQQMYDFLDVISILKCNYYITPGDNDIGSDKSNAYFKELINGNKEYYRYFAHNGVHFIILSSKGFDDSFKEQQMIWLKDVLKELKAQPVFIFVHKPVYSYKNDEKPDEELVNLINEYKIDAVFSGHEHVFNKIEEGATVYFITGVSGSRPYFYPEEGGYQGFMIIDIKKDSWVYHMINIAGQVVEEKEYDFK